MSNIDNFKAFVKKNPELITHVKNNSMTWQKYYEIYNLYGEDNNIWNDYVIKNEKESTKEKNSNWDTFVKMTKNLDVNKVQSSITSLQKTLGLFGDLFSKGDSTISKSTYEPRPVYRKFED